MNEDTMVTVNRSSRHIRNGQKYYYKIISSLLENLLVHVSMKLNVKMQKTFTKKFLMILKPKNKAISIK